MQHMSTSAPGTRLCVRLRLLVGWRAHNGAPLPCGEAAQPCLTFACMTLEMACLMTSSLLLFCATTKQMWDMSQVISN